MADFNIGILSTLDIDSNSSKKQINESIKQLQKNLDSITVGLEIDSKGQKRALNSAIKSISSELNNVKIGLDVDVAKSRKNINSAIKQINNELKDKNIKIGVTAEVDKASLNNAKRTASKNLQGNNIEFDKGLNKAETADVKALQDALFELSRTYKNVDDLKARLNTNNDPFLRHEIKEIKNADQIATDYIITLKKLNDTQQTVARNSISYKADPSGALRLNKVVDNNKQYEADVVAQQKITKEIESQIAAINKLNANGKISVKQAQELAAIYKKIDVNSGNANEHTSRYNASHDIAQKMLTDYREQNKLLDQQQRLVAQIERSERRLADSIDKRATHQLKDRVNNLGSQSNPFGKNAAFEMAQIQGQVRMITAEAERATRSQLGFVESFRQAMIKFPVWMGASTLFFGAIQSGRTFINTVTEIDSKMITLAKVSQDGTNLAEVFNSANEAALQFGQTISGVLDAYAEFARQGMPQQDMVTFGNAALIASNVGEIGAGQAAEYLTSMSAQWETEAKDAMGQVDALNEISNKYATTVEKLAQGQAKAGSTAKSMGMTFDETNAVIGTLTAKTKQSGDEIGNFMKAVLPKLYNGKGARTIEGLGIDLKGSDGQLKGAMTLLEEVAQKTKTLDKAQRAAVINGIGGVYHYQRMQVLLEDLAKADSMYKDIKRTSENSDGSALAENAKYMESVEAKINRAKVSIEQFSVALGDAFLKAGILDGLRLFTDLLTKLTVGVSSLGSAAPIFGTLGVAVALFSRNVRSGFADAIQGFADFRRSAEKEAAAINNINRLKQVGTVGMPSMSMPTNSITGLKNATTANANLASSMRNVTTSSTSMQAAMVGNTAVTNSSVAASRAGAAASTMFATALRGLLAATGVGLVVAGISFGIEKLIGHFDKASQATEKFNQQQSALKMAVESQGASPIEKNIDEYEKFQRLLASGQLDTTQMEQYKNVTGELANIFPDLVSGESKFGANIQANAGILRARLEITKQQIAVEKQLAQEKAKADQDEALRNAANANKDTYKTYSALDPRKGELQQLKYDAQSTGGVGLNKIVSDGELEKLDAKIQKVKGLESATTANAMAEKLYAQAKAGNANPAELQILKDRVNITRQMTQVTGQALTANLAAIQNSAQIFNTNISSILSRTKGIGDAAQTVFGTISNSIMSSTNNAKQADSTFTQFLNTLNRDTGFQNKMKAYEKAIKDFNNADNPAEKEAALKKVEAAYDSMAESVLKVAKASGQFNNKEINELATSLEANNNALLGVEGAMQRSAEAAAEAIDDNEKLADSMRNIANDSKLVNSALEEMQNGNLTWETMTDLVDKYGERVLALAGDEQALTDFLISERDREASHYQQIMQAKLGMSEQYYQQVAGQGTALYNHMKKVYGIDMGNYKTMNQFKAKIGDLWSNGTQKQQASLVDAVAKHYGIDVSNFGTLAEKKQAVENRLMQTLGSQWAEYINYIAETTNQTFAAIGENARLAQTSVNAAAALGGIPTGMAAAANVSLGLIDKVGMMNFAVNQSFQSDAVFQSATAAMTNLNNVAGNLGQGLQNLNDVGKAAGDGLGKAGDGAGKAGKGAGKAAKGLKDTTKAAKEVKEAVKDGTIEVERLYKTFTLQTYVADKLAISLERVNAALEKQKEKTSKYATWSASYRKSLKEENKLLDQQYQLHDRQYKRLASQIKSGKIKDYGLVDSEVSVGYNQYSAKGVSGNQTAKVKPKSSIKSYVGGNSTEAKVWNKLKALGFTDAAAAGVMGNFKQESQMNPAIEQFKGQKYNGGKGLAQWDGVRRNKLYELANKRGKSWTNIDVQLEMLANELKDPFYNNKYDNLMDISQIKKLSDPTRAATEFQKTFERAGIPNQSARNSYAKSYYSKYKGGTVKTPKASYKSRATSSKKSTAKSVKTPLAMAAQTFLKYKRTTNYHPNGGTPGYKWNGGVHQGLDFSTPVGTPIKAPTNGVNKKSWGGGGGLTAEFIGDDGYTQYFMHLLKMGKTGRVKAGDVIAYTGGQVGNPNSGWQNSGPHVHYQVRKTSAGTQWSSGLVNPYTYLGLSTKTGQNIGSKSLKRWASGAKSSGSGSKISYSTGKAASGNISADYASQLNEAEQAELERIERYIKALNAKEQNKDKVAKARSDAIKLLADKRATKDLKGENLFNYHKSFVDWYDHQIELQAAKNSLLQYELDKLKYEKGEKDPKYIKKKKEYKNSYDYEEGLQLSKIKYINSALKNNKHFPKDSQYRDEMESLKRAAQQSIRDLRSNARELKGEIASILVDTVMYDFEEAMYKKQKIIDEYGKKRQQLDLQSTKNQDLNVKYLKVQASHQEAIVAQINYSIIKLKQQNLQIKNNKELQEKVKQQIRDLTSQYEDAKIAAYNFNQELMNTKIENVLSKQADRLKSYQRRYQKAEYEGNFISQEYQPDLYRENQAEKIRALRYEHVGLVKNKQELEKQLTLYKKMPTQARRIKDAIEEVTNQIQESNKNIHSLRYDLANSVINSIKTIYQKQLDVAIKNYDKEYKEYEKMVNKKLKLIDKEANKEQYDKDVNDKQKEINKLKAEIAKRQGDDSLSNKNKLKELQEQLKTQQDDYDSYMRNKAREDRRSALQEELDDKNTQLDKQREDVSRAYEDLLENTRYFNQIQEQLMEGHTDKYAGMINNLLAFVQNNMQDIGFSVSQNIMDGLTTTYDNLKDLAAHLQAEELINPVPNSRYTPEGIKPKPAKPAPAKKPTTTKPKETTKPITSTRVEANKKPKVSSKPSATNKQPSKVNSNKVKVNVGDKGTITVSVDKGKVSGTKATPKPTTKKPTTTKTTSTTVKKPTTTTKKPTTTSTTKKPTTTTKTTSTKPVTTKPKPITSTRPTGKKLGSTTTKPPVSVSSAAIKAVNSLAPKTVSAATAKLVSAKLPAKPASKSTTVNNTTKANSLVNIQNFNGTKKEVDNLSKDLAAAMRKQGFTL